MKETDPGWRGKRNKSHPPVLGRQRVDAQELDIWAGGLKEP